MPAYEYTAIPAPLRSEKAKAAKTPAERYALTLTDEINRMAADGWEYLRAETLPSEERSGLTGRTTLFHNLLIFRRETASASQRAEAPVAAATAPAPPPQDSPKPAVQDAPKSAPPKAAAPSPIFSETMRLAEQPGQDSAAPASRPAD